MSVEFDGATEYMDCGSSASIDDIFDGGGTISFWINVQTYAVNDYPFGKNDFTWYIETGVGDLIRFTQVFDGATNGRWSIPGPSAGTWAHITIAYNNGATANDPNIYLDGVLQAETEVGTPDGTRVSDAAGDMLIGTGDTSGNFGYDGELEDFRLFPRMITVQGAAALAAGYRGPLGSEALWLDMEGVEVAAVATVADKTTNKNHGTPQNGPVYRASKAPRYG